MKLTGVSSFSLKTLSELLAKVLHDGESPAHSDTGGLVGFYGSARGVSNFTNYLEGPLLETGGF